MYVYIYIYTYPAPYHHTSPYSLGLTRQTCPAQTKQCTDPVPSG